MVCSNDVLPIKAIVDKVISGLNPKDARQHRLSEEDIGRLWRKAAGKIAGQRSKPSSLRKGKLVVTVGDSSLLYDLTLRKREILEALAKDLKDKIQDIQFRIGEIGGKEKIKNQKSKIKN